MEKKATERARGIDRAIAILDYLKTARHPVAIGDLARALKAPRSSIYDIVARLQKAGILENDSESAVYFGRTVYFYADAYLASQPVVRLGRDEVVRLGRVTGETAQFCLLVGNKYTVAYMQPGANLFRISSETGVVVPIPWTASGRLLLGGMSDAEILELIPPEDFILPSGKIIETDAFLKDVRKASESNRMTTTGLSDPYTTCLAAAIRDRWSKPVSTICFMVPFNTPQERKDELLEMLRQSTDMLTQKLNGGYDG